MTEGDMSFDSTVEERVAQCLKRVMEFNEKTGRWGFPKAKAIGNYVPARKTGNIIQTSGQIPTQEGSWEWGKIGRCFPHISNIKLAQKHAEECAVKCIAALKTIVSTLDKVRVIKITCMVNSTDDFFEHHLVANGASDFIVKVFGEEKGLHAREAFGVAALPLNAPVEISMIAEVIE